MGRKLQPVCWLPFLVTQHIGLYPTNGVIVKVSEISQIYPKSPSLLTAKKSPNICHYLEQSRQEQLQTRLCRAPLEWSGCNVLCTFEQVGTKTKIPHQLFRKVISDKFLQADVKDCLHSTVSLIWIEISVILRELYNML